MPIPGNNRSNGTNGHAETVPDGVGCPPHGGSAVDLEPVAQAWPIVPNRGMQMTLPVSTVVSFGLGFAAAMAIMHFCRNSRN